MISFIITTYNLPVEMLRECFDSIMALSLTREQREIILIDDGSETSPLYGLSTYADDIIYLRQPNSGLSVARNTGLKLATGKFIQFVDGDDSLIQADYEHCVDLIRYHEPVDMVMFFATQTKNHPVDFSCEGPMTGVNYMEANNVRAAAWGYVFRKECLGDLRFTQGIFHEDEEFTPQLLLRVKSLYVTKAKAYYYRKRNGSITHSLSKENKDKRLGDTLGVILRLKEIAGNCEDNKRVALERRVAQLTMDYLVNIIRLTRSHDKLNEAIATLTGNGLYPLPDKHYTRKYALFRRLIQNKAGRVALMTLL